jgi:hypothetical protein
MQMFTNRNLDTARRPDSCDAAAAAVGVARIRLAG